MSDETYHWKAIYSDGTFLDEYDDEVDGHGFADVDLSRCIAVAFVPQVHGLSQHVAQCDPATGKRPIMFRHRTVTLDGMTGEVQSMNTISVLGWQKTVNGVNVASYSFLYADGSVLISDNDTAGWT